MTSTQTMLNTPMAGAQRMQAEMTRLNTEITTSRVADPGLSFGTTTGRDVTFHVDLDALSATVTSANLASSRLDQTQSALTQMSTDANSFLDELVSSPQQAGAVTTLQQDAQSALSSFAATANTSDGGDYLFGGINSSVAPLADPSAGPKAAVDAAFLAKFGFTQDDPAAASISSADMSDFLNNQFAALFSDPSWGTTWSQASDQTMSTRLSPTESITSSVSANTPAMRKLAMVYTMVADLGLDHLSADAQKAVLDKASSVAGDGISDLTNVQAAVGNDQNQLKDGISRLNTEQDIAQQRLTSMEGVDPAQAKVQVDQMSTEIEMSYSLTAKLLQMSLLNYA
jgi:flagellar hook-associated protein 3 FlgL